MKKRNFTLQKLLLVCVFCCIHFFAFAQPELVKDINPNSNKMGSSPAELVEFNGMLYFIAEDEVHGEELWKSDGTEAGTIMVKDIYPGKNDGCWGQLTVAGGWLYFVGRDQSHGIELWKSDGTENGTVMVKDIYPGEYSGTPEYLTELNGEVFFSARNASNNTQLWKSDGTEAGTMQVSTNCSRPKNITNVNGTLFFSCNEQYIEISFEPPEGLVYIDLYKSDGTTPGTVIISTLYGGMIIGGMPYEIEVDNFIYANNLVFFQFSFDDQAGWFNESRTTLYTYNGSLLQALLTGKYNNDSDTYIGINDILYFTHNSYSNGNSLWRSDGTLGNTYEIYNFECNEIDNFASFNGTLYFTGRTYNYTNILKLYQCDGVNVTELKSFGDYSATIGTIFQNSLYFTARPYEGSSELWKITGSNTTFIESYPFISILGAYNNSMFMELNEGIHGNEFWKSNGNPGGSMLIKDINFGSADSDPENLTAFSNTILFSANDGSHGIEIWKSDGSTAGTALLKDICVGVEDSEPQYFTNFNNITIFNANDGINGGELWKTDGSTSGTVLIKDIYPGTEGSYPYHITRSGSNVYFTAYTATNGRELWKTNGSASGTVLLKDIYPGSSLHHAPEKLVDGNGVLFFTAEGDPYGRELWKSSGTSATTVIVKDIYSGSTGSYPDYLTFSNGWLFFSASSSGNGEELWKSNGTGSGTVMVKDIRPGSSSSGPEYLTFSNGILFFSAGSSENGRELWRSDGTENGTVLVRDIIQGSSGSEPEDLIDVNGTLFFTAEDGINGRELWKSDGTENGTILVKDMNPGTGDGSYYDFFNVNGTLFFTFFNEVLGMELWKTNGFEFGTVLVDDLYEGDNSSTPKYLASISNNIYFAADDGPGHGRELWRYENVDIILPPENLHAELLNFTDVKLTWEAPQPPKGKLLKALEGFNVYRNNQLLNPAPLTTLTYNDPGRPAGLYNYYVTSVYSAEESDPSNNEEVLVTTQFTVDLKCFLEGPFNGTDMDPWLNDVIPLNQPFDTIPWNYNGIEKVQAIPGPDIVDWVLVEIRETAGEAAYATPETRVAIKAAFLLSNGSVVDQDGISPLVFNHKVYGSLYAVIYHRNHIPVLSQLPLQLNDHTFTYDFTTGADKVYGGSLSYKQLAPGIWGLSGGDGNADEFVNNADKNDIWVPQAGQSGYRQGDFDLNRQVNNGDKLDIWVVNTGLGGQLPPPFTCGDSIIDLRDGKKYSTLSIGTQCWMGENMNTGTMLNGNEEQENNGIIEKYCYDNDSANCGEYGGLYKWDEAMQYVTTEGSKGICPPTGGWHIPADEEWKMLEGAVDSQFDYPDSEWDGTGWRGFDAGLNLKTTTGWYGGGNGTDLFGFSAKPAGFRNTGGDFQSLFEGTFFWTSKEYQLVDKWRRGYDWNHESSNRYYVSKYYAPSVRCIKDSVLNNPPNQPGEPIPFNGAVQISLDTLLSWSCTDPDSDAITYSVYLGLSPEPGFFFKDLTASQCNTGPLIADTLYYWKVVATDTRGDSTISPVWAFHTTSFECGGLLLDSRDNRVYKTILIGNQCWMAENLNIGVRIDGANNQADNSTFEKYCYDNDPANCETYGGLYQWDEAMQYVTDETAQGICPDGWHMPTDWQWQILEGTADSQYPVIDPEWDNLGWRGFDAGGNLKETGTTHWNSPNTGATNFSGFTALPGGRRDPSGDFNVIGDYSYWWSASQSGSNRWSRRLHFINVQINRNEHSKSYGFSIRCLKDSLESNHSPNIPSNPYPADGSVDISIDTLLHWSASDPDPGDVLLYNIYFGLENNPPLAATKQFDTVYNPGAMYNDSVYYWKVVAVDIYGDSAVSPVWSFTTRSFACGDALADARDGQSYNTVLIGNQCWMAENMNIGSYKPGSYELTDNGYIERYCYGDNPANCDTYGGLYQWEEAMHYVPLPGAKGICPQGWHIPTDYEWKVLEGTVDTQFPVGDPEWDNTGWRGFDAGGNLKETGTSHWSSPNTGATNSSGFTALPAGYRDISASFGEVSITTTWWSSVLLDDDNGWRRRVRYNNQQITRNTSDNGYGFSVRCLKNPANQPPTMPSSPTPENGATNITIDTVLTWVATDPDFDPMYFSIYLGTTPNPPLITEKHLTAIYNPGVLYNDSTYYWKIVAFDIHGDSAVGPVWSFTTSPFACGDPLPVNHTAGDVAPVSKTVNYGTVETNLTGTNQCWITQNLGSDQQATSSTDATEASAGWYWQFNCKQGYKHDGTTRTPNTTWITSIDENSDWQTANDPCTILLGSGWRLPTYTEWNNADQNGGWNNRNDTYNSVLNLHAAGYLSLYNGSLFDRGTSGYYWSSTQSSATNSWGLYFGISYSGMPTHFKTIGFIGRCLRD